MFANTIPGKAQVGQKIIISGASATKWYKDGQIYTVAGNHSKVILNKMRSYYYVEEASQGCVVFEEDALIFLGENVIHPREEIVAELQRECEALGGTCNALEAELSGGSVNYYKVEVKNPVSGFDPYTAECSDIIEALGMNYAEGNIFKAIWRSCAARTLGKKKKGQDDDGYYDACKALFFAQRLVVQRGGES